MECYQIRRFDNHGKYVNEGMDCWSLPKMTLQSPILVTIKL